MLDLKQKIEEGIRPLVEESGLDLVETRVLAAGRNRILRVFVDKLKGVSIAECAALSRRISIFLDQEDLIPYSYTLEVSSPGLDRPLFNRADFARKVGEKVRILLKDKSQAEASGIITGVSEQEVTLTQEEEEVRIDLDSIEKGFIQF